MDAWSVFNWNQTHEREYERSGTRYSRSAIELEANVISLVAALEAVVPTSVRSTNFRG